ncbi:acyl-CoA dehydrogenase family protein [Bradyrhizobium liaoningense]|uniref:acyl-CoA dehydrogenase family protein n=1 Tax=Bradyrhizobium liaoningense TaxID=43992 RepID=UPI00235BDEC7|nr:acyl-CoA dehydrogenase family protein [Bradyrhizobium liaoningense]GLR95171.1 acyl-CoA dehydrogenase short-chain specific [Bradyrhizobium liaoningense]
MDIQLTEEQELLRSSIQRFLREQYDFDERRKIVATDEGWSRKHWSAFAELGLCAAPFQESSGGLGGGSLATMIVMQEFGRSLVVEPYFETVVLAGGLIEEAGSSEQRQAFLREIMDGSAIWTLAWAEGKSRYDFNNVATTAQREGDDFVLNGAKAAVIGAPWADRLIVSARTSGGPRDRAGVSLFVIDRHSPNLHLQSFKTIDGRRAAELTLGDVRVPASQMLGAEGEGVAVLEACRDRAIAALCAEAVGAMSVLNSTTLEYSKVVRKQFGTALGTFQVLQHRMVDMFIALEESVSLTQHLNLSLAAREPNGSKLASGAKSKVGYAARFIAEQAVQLHGGMGMSDELDVGHYFKRISSINIQFGDPAYHLMRYAQQS